jgi:hypothetical protein
MAELLDYATEHNWKGRETSALLLKLRPERAPVWRARCLAVIAAAPRGLTACQVAAELNHDVASTRPRITELVKLGKVEPTGERRSTRWAQRRWSGARSGRRGDEQRPLLRPAAARRAGTVHVWRVRDDEFQVSHESASGSSWGAVTTYPAAAKAVSAAYALNREAYGGQCDVRCAPMFWRSFPPTRSVPALRESSDGQVFISAVNGPPRDPIDFASLMAPVRRKAARRSQQSDVAWLAAAVWLQGLNGNRH